MSQPRTPDRLPPHSIEAEQGVLGCALLSPVDCIAQLREKKLNTLWFYDLRHQHIWTAMLALDDDPAKPAVDVITVQQWLKDRQLLEQIGGIPYLNALQDAVPSAANISYYAEIVHEKFLLRKVLKLCSETVGRVYDFEGEVTQLLDEVERDFSSFTESATESAEKSMKTIIQNVIADMEENHYTRGQQQLRGLPMAKPGNYTDKIVRGIRPAHYVVMAGRPGDGKTSYAMNVVEYLATDYVWHEPTGEKREDNSPVTVERRGIPVAIFSIEMDHSSLGYRLLFGRAGVDSSQYEQGYAGKGDDVKLTNASGKLAKANIWVDDSPAQSIGQIAAKARRMVKQYGIKLFVLDYLQLVETEDGNGFDRVKELTKISRKIMALKKQLQVPWLVLAQMNRNIEQTENKGKRVPVLSDLKDCGAIEQDADVVMFLYKPDRREINEQKSYQDNKSDVELIDDVYAGEDASIKPRRVNLFVAKNRYGPTGNVQLLFQNNLCRFHDWHQWKVEHNLEARKAGESERSLGLAQQEHPISDDDLPRE